MQWQQAVSETCALASCLADGTVQMLRLDPDSNTLKKAACSEPTGAVLMALNWSGDALCTGDTDGMMHIFQDVCEDGSHIPDVSALSWKAHDLECWQCKFQPQTDNQLVPSNVHVWLCI